MPMYSYFCAACNRTDEQFRPMERRGELAVCPKCDRATIFVKYPQDTIKSNPRDHVKDVFRKV